MSSKRRRGTRAAGLCLSLIALTTAESLSLLLSQVSVEAQQTHKATWDEDSEAYNLNSRAWDLMQKENYKEAAPLLEKAATYDESSNSGCIHQNLAVVYYQLKDMRRCAQEAAKALQFNADADIAFEIGAGYGAIGRANEGVKLVRQHAKSSDE